MALLSDNPVKNGVSDISSDLNQRPGTELIPSTTEKSKTKCTLWGCRSHGSEVTHRTPPPPRPLLLGCRLLPDSWFICRQFNEATVSFTGVTELSLSFACWYISLIGGLVCLSNYSLFHNPLAVSFRCRGPPQQNAVLADDGGAASPFTLAWNSCRKLCSVSLLSSSGGLKADLATLLAYNPTAPSWACWSEGFHVYFPSEKSHYLLHWCSTCYDQPRGCLSPGFWLWPQ